MFKKVLIANRGEISCRIIRTCKKLGVATVAVYSYPDVDSPHVWEASEAYYLGAGPATQSYLHIEKIIQVAKKSGAEAIHPGYGFLSENGDFAEACNKAGIVFIGPPAEVHRQMGNKRVARAMMKEAGVPIVPGSEIEIADDSDLEKVAKQIGFPIIVKASEGGGGIGISIARQPEQLKAGVETALSRAKRAFGSTKIHFERYLEDARHVEIQVAGDTHGNVIHLFERECSVQRRYQKVVEEAPSPIMDEKLRKAMTEAAIKAARKVNYTNVGTIEFLVDKERNFYFLEMNTRVQVEHGVTELITGVDMVEGQLRIAAGEPLPWKQEALKIKGHALESRLYAEDPVTLFPAPGRVHRFRVPTGKHIRVDTGVTEGQEITIYYDPMIAKVLTWGEDREDAIQRMSHALAMTEVEGLDTNLPLLKRVIVHPDFLAGAYDTRFLTRLLNREPVAS